MTEDLQWRRVYWRYGGSAISDPPCSGWQGCFAIPEDKKVFMFCPYSMKSWHLPITIEEYKSSVPVESPDHEFLAGLIKRNWIRNEKLSIATDYEAAERILKLLGEEAPARRSTVDSTVHPGPQEEDTPHAVKKSVKAGSRRAVHSPGKFVKVPRMGRKGQVLKRALDNGASLGISDTLSHFKISRSNLLSVLHALRKDHGIGYSVNGDKVSVELPVDVKDPFG